jgi:phosphatidylglycerol:prolipoprotein diacylglycerol transferase
MAASISYRPIPITDLGPISVSLHGVGIGLGLAVGAWLLMRDVDRRGFDGDAVVRLLAVSLLGALLLARAFTVPPALLSGESLGDAFGSQSSLAGIAGGVLLAWLMARRSRISLVALLDMAALSLGVGIILARLGDVAIVEHLGSETDFALGYRLEPGYVLAPQHSALQAACDVAGDCGTYHHTALYDLIGAVVFVAVLVWLRRRWSAVRYGQMFGLWALWYGMQRFLVDFARLGAARDGLVADSVIGPLTASQWGAAVLAAIGVGILVVTRGQPAISPAADLVRGAVHSR